ncbi:hypothetical protein MMC13_002419 [Lambiella insularis]|nr:hypothetical protein [Lambiella insularis]
MCYQADILPAYKDVVERHISLYRAIGPPERFLREDFNLNHVGLCLIHKVELEHLLSRLATTIVRDHQQQLLVEYQCLLREEPNAYKAIMDSIQRAANHRLRAVFEPLQAAADAEAEQKAIDEQNLDEDPCDENHCDCHKDN